KIEKRNRELPPAALACCLRLRLFPPLRFRLALRRPHRYPHFQAFRQRAFDAQDHRQNRLTANRFELFAVVRGLVGAARPAMLRRVHVQKSLHHLVLVERSQQQSGRFTRANHQFSGTQGHAISPVRETCGPRNRNLEPKSRLCPKKKRPGVSSGPLRLSPVSYRSSSPRCLMHRSWSWRPFLTNGSSRNGPNLLVKPAERNFESLFSRVREVNLHPLKHLRL